ncbi:MAG: hypothetical protein ACXVCV_18980, partial [Polyangia bacterium]
PAATASAPAPAATASAPAPAAPDDAVTPQRHALAIAANTQGLRFYRANQLPRAAMRFRDATLLDPAYALAHYNLACMASRLRGLGTLVAELAWLHASADPVAVAKLEKARIDPDLDFASSLPTARALLGLAPFDAHAPLAWLAERHGTWSVELPTDDCAVRSYSFAFAPSGDLTLTVKEACGGKPLRAHTFTGTTNVDGDGVLVRVDKWPIWPDGVRLGFAACPGLADAPGSCFALSAAGSEVGPFHRGEPGISPMHARRNVADAAAR